MKKFPYNCSVKIFGVNGDVSFVQSLLVNMWATQTALEAAAAIAGSEGGGGDSEASPELREAVSKSLEGFDAGMNDDLNTPR